MRRVKMPVPPPDEKWFNTPGKTIISAGSLDDVESINYMLEKHGLELVEYDWGHSDILIELRKLGK